MKERKSVASRTAEIRREACRRLEQLRRVENQLDTAAHRRAAIDETIEKNRERAAALRAEIARLVDLAGGCLNLPGADRALHFQSVTTLEYDNNRLQPWLQAHAPKYTRTETRVDRVRLKAALRLRDGKAFLNGTTDPVDGVTVRSVRNLVIPKKKEK